MKRNIHLLPSMFVVLGLFAALLHVHQIGISVVDGDSPTSHQVSQEYNFCPICAYHAEGEDISVVTQHAELAFADILEIPSNSYNTITLSSTVSDRAPPFLV